LDYLCFFFFHSNDLTLCRPEKAKQRSNLDESDIASPSILLQPQQHRKLALNDSEKMEEDNEIWRGKTNFDQSKNGNNSNDNPAMTTTSPSVSKPPEYSPISRSGDNDQAIPNSPPPSPFLAQAQRMSQSNSSQEETNSNQNHSNHSNLSHLSSNSNPLVSPTRPPNNSSISSNPNSTSPLQILSLPNQLRSPTSLLSQPSLFLSPNNAHVLTPSTLAISMEVDSNGFHHQQHLRLNRNSLATNDDFVNHFTPGGNDLNENLNNNIEEKDEGEEEESQLLNMNDMLDNQNKNSNREEGEEEGDSQMQVENEIEPFQFPMPRKIGHQSEQHSPGSFSFCFYLFFLCFVIGFGFGFLVLF
jgi:hypothetical protein